MILLLRARGAAPGGPRTERTPGDPRQGRARDGPPPGRRPHGPPENHKKGDEAAKSRPRWCKSAPRCRAI
eukprot:9427153-Pyramimonas_sp.AAC.1